MTHSRPIFGLLAVGPPRVAAPLPAAPPTRPSRCPGPRATRISSPTSPIGALSSAPSWLTGFPTTAPPPSRRPTRRWSGGGAAPPPGRAQQRELVEWQRRLAAFDTTGWSIPQQVDYHVVRAELNGLDFDHRVLRPWARNPGFYVTVFWDQSDQPAREGPFAYGAVELWKYPFPLRPADLAQLEPGIRAIPGLLAQARQNLTGNAADLWTYGTKAIKQQSADLAQLASR